MLHTINKSPFQNTALESCVRFLQDSDVILLLEDGVYAALSGTSQSNLLETVLQKNEVYAINADLKARALTKIIPGVKMTDYAGFVELVEKHATHAWL